MFPRRFPRVILRRLSLALPCCLFAASCGGGGGGGGGAPAPATLVGRVAIEGAQSRALTSPAVLGDEGYLQARDLGELTQQVIVVDGRVDAANPRDCLRVAVAAVASIRVSLRTDAAIVAVHRLPRGIAEAHAVGTLDSSCAEVVVPVAPGDHLLMIVSVVDRANYRLELTGQIETVLPPAASATALAQADAALVSADAEIVPGEVIVGSGDGDTTAAISVAGRYGLEPRSSGGGFCRCVVANGLALTDGREGRLALASLLFDLRRQLPANVIAEPNFVMHAHQAPRTTNDPRFGDQWAHRVANTSVGWGITTGAAVVLAVVDSGIRSLHPDLRDNVLTDGYDFIDNDPSPEDPLVPGASLHGSHVAGIAAGVTNNAVGIAGVGWNTKILPVRVLGSSGSGSMYGVAQGVLYAARLPNSSQRLPAQRARVINLSLGTPSTSSVLLEAIRSARQAGSIVVAAAGNEAESGNPISYPAAYDEVIAVGAVGPSGNRAPYSQFHPYVDIAAPGGDKRVRSSDGILSTVSVERGGQWYFDYAYYQGTSMAAPFVAGAIALMLAANDRLTADDVTTILSRTATDRGAPGRDPEYGAGLIDVGRAVAQAVGGRQPALRVDRAEMVFGHFGSAVVAISSDGAEPIAGLTATPDAPWLRASLDAAATPARLMITADHSAFGAGPAKDGRVSIQGAGGAVAEVRVRAMSLVVLARSPAGVTTMTPVNGGFSLVVAPAGECELRLVADTNGNGSYEDAGDYDSGVMVVGLAGLSGVVADVGVLTARKR